MPKRGKKKATAKKLLNLIRKKGGNGGGPRRKKKGGNGLSAWVQSKFLSGGLSYGNGPPVAKHTTPMRLGMRYGNGSDSNGTLAITGRDLIQTLTVNTTNAVGDVLCDIWVNPIRMQAPRLAVLSGMYERYVINYVRFVFEGSVPTTQNGTILGFYDYDILEIPPTTGGGAALIQRAAAHTGAKPAKVWESGMWQYLPDRAMTDLYCDTASYEPRLTTPAHFILLVNDLPTMTANLSIGKLYVEYGITFLYPKIQTSAPSPLWGFEFTNSSGAGVTPDVPLGTTITPSAWNSISKADLITDYQDGSGNKCTAVVLPAPGDYLCFFSATKPSTTTAFHTAYTSLPGVSGSITGSVDINGDGPTSSRRGYFTQVDGVATSGSAMTTTVNFNISSVCFYHAVDTGAHVWARGASDCTGLVSRFAIVRLPALPTLGSDMYVQYTKMVGQMRSFTRQFAPQLRDAGIPPDDIFPTPTWVNVEPEDEPEQHRGAAASAAEMPPLDRPATLQRVRR